ncbi:hypothetical protein [Helicobacter rodentium]|nr:hypothetical protein [Helicobacter rodentium]
MSFFCHYTLPLRHCEASAEAIYNQAHIKSYHLVIARMRSIRGNP